MTQQHTQGPWRWEINRTSKSIQLVGGRPTFDKTVMDFERWGMGGAAPRFNSAITGNEFNIMFRVSDRQDWIADFTGRHHHAHWCADVIHPDARLIAAAPDLHKEGGDLIERLKEMAIHPSHYAGLEAAIAKATGSAA